MPCDAQNQLLINNQPVTLTEAQMTQSLLQVLREDLGLVGTKEGCASGDCGACTVVAATPGQGPHSLNSCIAPAGSFIGGSVLTVEGVGQPGNPHPVQQAMIECHGAQCGFCTPGFVMSMVAGQIARNGVPCGTLTEASTEISGNLCRCTGYRPILDAALLSAPAPSDQFNWLNTVDSNQTSTDRYLNPSNQDELVDALAHFRSEDRWIIVAGATDAWLEWSQRYQDFAGVLDLSRLAQLQGIERHGQQLAVGAGTSHEALLGFFTKQYPVADIAAVLHRFGSPQVRARGTIGGNIGNASPIADWPPMLLVLDAQLVLLNSQGKTRRVALSDFYLGYRETVRAADEVITQIEFDLPDPQTFRASKISKRTEDDISSVLLACQIVLDKDGAIKTLRLAMGGVAATPVRLQQVEDALVGQPLATLHPNQIEDLCDVLDGQIQPISDVRASAQYRMAMAKSLFAAMLIEAAYPQTREDLHHV